MKVFSAPVSAGSRPTVCKFEEGPVNVVMTGPESGRRLWTAQLRVRIDPGERFAYLIQNIVNDASAMLEDAPFVDWTEADRG